MCILKAFFLKICTQEVKIMKVEDEVKIVAMAKVIKEDEEEDSRV